jgi:SAM-dependent methyltransferase
LGKSDAIVYPWYKSKSILPQGGHVLFLGQTRHNDFTSSISCRAEFLDISLGNWEINAGPWPNDKFDAVVCTRCAYFSSDAQAFIEKCKSMTKPGGIVFIDWGLGDHWRFKEFKVGWRSDSEEETVLFNGHRSSLRSAFWHPRLEDHSEVQKFKTWIKKFGYEGSLTDHILRETSSVSSDTFNCVIDCLSIWPDAPQLYILTQFKV